jgi:hypothetical protein
MRRVLVCLAVVAVAVTGCGGGSSATDPNPSVVSTAAPNLEAFLRLPVATPSACPSNVSGSTDGRTSVWAGRVDLSVFVSLSASTRQTLKLGNLLRADSRVRAVYYESKKQAYEEFQRLYTCWTSVPRSQTPASYRVDLLATVSITERNVLVAHLARMSDVDTVSCNPIIPCTSSLPPATSSPSPQANTMR